MSARFEVSTAALLKVHVFRDITRCGGLNSDVSKHRSVVIFMVKQSRKECFLYTFACSAWFW